MNKDLATFLKFTPFFGGISNDIINKMIRLSKEQTIDAGDNFFIEGDQAQSMFVLIKGSVEVFKTWEGRKYPIATMYQGDCFGEMSIIDHCSRSATVIALEKCEILEIGIESFAAIYKDDLKQYTMLQMNIGRELSRRLREANDLLFRLKVTEKFEKPSILSH